MSARRHISTACRLGCNRIFSTLGGGEVLDVFKLSASNIRHWPTPQAPASSFSSLTTTCIVGTDERPCKLRGQRGPKGGNGLCYPFAGGPSSSAKPFPICSTRILKSHKGIPGRVGVLAEKNLLGSRGRVNTHDQTPISNASSAPLFPEGTTVVRGDMQHSKSRKWFPPHLENHFPPPSYYRNFLVKPEGL